MRLYHFLNEHYGLKALCDQRLKLAEITELNDPFEFLSVDLSDEDNRKTFNGLKLSFSEDFGLLCFSKNWRSPVQWTHYADNHKGLCLGFDIPSNELTEVSYVEEKLALPTTEEEFNGRFVIQVISTKHSHWEYEKEYRHLGHKENKINGLYFINFSKKLELKEIIVGEKSDITYDGIHKILGGNNSNIEIFKVRASFKEFKMVKQKNKNLWK